jgi:HlyD family secretion protein
MKITATVFGAILLLAGTGWFYKRADGGGAPIYRTATIERGSVKSTVSATGTLSAVQTIQVGTQVSGQIAAIYADYNDHVRSGQLLASIDPALENQAVEEAQAQVERALATTQQAEADYDRGKQLFDVKAITASEFGTLQSNLAVQKANVKSARIALDRARQNLAYTRIYAPINGVIVERNVDVGQTVAANFSAPQLFLIARDLSDMQILAAVDESDIGAIRTGQPVEFTVQAYPSETFIGSVQQVRLQSKTQDNVVNYTVVVGVHNTTGKLLPGMTATAQFITGNAHDVLVVPNSALRVRMGGMGDGGRGMGDAGSGRQQSESRQRAAGTGQLEAVVNPAQSQTRSGNDDAAGASSAILWTLDNQGTLRPVRVRPGLSDESHTEVSGTGLTVGTKIVIGVTGGATSGDVSGSSSPFENPRPSGGGGDKGG